MEKRKCKGMKRQLILEDGTIFIGEAFGADTNCVGEVVFNTGMTGIRKFFQIHPTVDKLLR